MNELETKVLEVVGSDAGVTNKDVIGKVGADAKEVRRVLKQLEAGGKIRVVDRRKGAGRGRPASVWGLSESESNKVVNA